MRASSADPKTDPGLALALAALVEELRGELRSVDGAVDHAITDDEALSVLREAMPRLLSADAVDDPDSLSRADLYRIRAAKLVARLLPPGSLADRDRRRRLRARVRELIAQHLGADLEPSVYLDPQTVDTS